MAQDVIVREEDCVTKDHIEMAVNLDGQPNDNLLGRFAAKEFKTKRGRSLLSKGKLITQVELDELAEAFADDDDAAVPVRSVMKCEADAGVCQQCYGVAPATGKVVRSATRWASSPPSRSASPARS